MKQITLFLSCFFLFTSCSEKKITSATNNSLLNPNQVLASNETKVYNAVKWDILDRAKDNTARSKSSGSLLSPQVVERMEVYRIPYYEFNEEDFFKDPTPERIITCCYPPEDKMMFIGKMSGEIVSIFEASKKKDKWYIGIFYDDANFIKETLSWIPKKIEYPDSSHLKLITIYGLQHFAYTNDNKTTYYRFTGQPEAYESELFDYIVSAHENAKGLKEFFDKTGGHVIKGDSLIPIEEFMKREKNK